MASVAPIMNPDVQRILTFWFDRNPMDWMRAPEGFDDQCRSQFGDLVLKARGNELDDWAATPEGSLGLVVLLNQLMRNIFRGSVDAFSGDAKAAEIATRAIARDFDKQVTVMQASALYIALLAQENLISIVAARALCDTLKPRCTNAEEHDWVDKGIAAAKMHVDLMVRFGRYPARNAVLGRKNTGAEDEFLAEHTQ